MNIQDYEQLTLFPEDSHANRFQTPGSAEAQQTTVISGRKCLELSKNCGENVAGIVSLALDTVLSDLEIQGYQARAFIIPACGVDAPHRRDRVAIVAYT